MLSAGKLTQRVTVQYVASQEVAEETGQRTDVFSDLCTVWAEVLGKGGSETRKGEQQVAQYTHKVTIRYRTDIDSSMRIIWGSRTLEIDNADDEDGRREDLVILCIETVVES